MFKTLAKRVRQACGLLRVQRLFTSRSSRTSASQNTLVLDFKGADIFFRYQFSLAFAFKMAGWNVAWVFRPKMFLQSWEFQANLAWAERSGILWCLRFPRAIAHCSKICILVTDIEEYAIESDKRIIRLKSLLPDSDVSKNDLIIPFFGYPEFLLKNWESATFSKKPSSRFRVCFAGNCDPAKYSQPVSDQCSVTRAGAKVLLTREFESQVMRIDLWEDKSRLATNETAKILFSDAFQAFLYLDEYVNALLASDFFLVLPGIASPLTHSLYESVFCGCIPILGQCDEYEMVWQDGKNCLIYHDDLSLVACVKKALDMTEEQLTDLRSNAKKTFEQNFGFSKFAESVANSNCNILWCRNV
jgi:hypothetical protein